jgi:gamma-glutamylaminecyclotransferase
MTLVFVYGTLKRGGSNHFHLAGQEFSGEAETGPGYVLYELGGYPGMVVGAGGPGIRGEVWSVDDECLARLDVLEGLAEGLFARSSVRLCAPFDGRSVDAYFYLPGVDGRARLGKSWTG